jgi:hypothetical protein
MWRLRRHPEQLRHYCLVTCRVQIFTLKASYSCAAQYGLRAWLNEFVAACIHAVDAMGFFAYAVKLSRFALGDALAPGRLSTN